MSIDCHHAQKPENCPISDLFNLTPKYFLQLLHYTDLVPPSTHPVPPSTNQCRPIFFIPEKNKVQNSIRELHCLLGLVLNNLLPFLTDSSHKDDSPVDYLGLLDQEGRRSRFSEVVDDRFRSFMYVFVLLFLSH